MRNFIFRWLLALALGVGAGVVRAAEPMPVVLAPKATPAERAAVEDFVAALRRVYPHERFTVTETLPATGRCVLVAGNLHTDPRLQTFVPKGQLPVPESFLVMVIDDGPRRMAVIIGADVLGTVYALNALLEKLGYGFAWSGTTPPPARPEPFSFEDWTLADAPLAPQRVLFRWHEFRPDCAEDPAQWEQWAVQALRLRFDTLVINSPPQPGSASPPRLAEADAGRVNNVRHLIGSESFTDFARPRGSAATPDDLIRKTFAKAKERGLHCGVLLDLDTPPARVQALIPSLPDRARFKSGDATLVLPDIAAGFGYYRAQVEVALDRFTPLDRLVLWVNRDSPWLSVALEDLPSRWRTEFQTATRTVPPGALQHAAGHFALSKISLALRMALRELERPDVQLIIGGPGIDWMPEAALFYGANVPFLGLDDDPHVAPPVLDVPNFRNAIRQLGAQRPIITVGWANSRDGAALGRSFRPPETLGAELNEAGNCSCGLAHWTMRSLDLFTKHFSRQSWARTAMQPLRVSAEELAGSTFGPAARGPLGEYWLGWATNAPVFGWLTGAAVVREPVSASTAHDVIAGSQAREALLKQIEPPRSGPQRNRWSRLLELEEFYRDFYHAETIYQQTCATLASHAAPAPSPFLTPGLAHPRTAPAPATDLSAAYALLNQHRPEAAVGLFARAAARDAVDCDDQAAIIALNLNWLARFDHLRQALGLDAVRVCYVPAKQLAADKAPQFYADQQKRLWRCVACTAPGVGDFALADETPPRSPEVTAADVGMCQTGIECEYPVQLQLRPFLHDVAAGAPTTLPAGVYWLKLLLIDPTSSAPGQRVFDVATGTGGEFMHYVFRPVKAKFLRAVFHGNVFNTTNSIAEFAVATFDRAAGTNAITASASEPNHPAHAAIDGDLATSWTAVGDGAWLQLALRPGAATAAIDIAWQDGSSYQCQFELFTSDDGQTWNKLVHHTEPAARVDAFKQAGGANRVFELALPLAVGPNGVATFSLTPQVGKAILCAATLEPIHAPQ